MWKHAANPIVHNSHPLQQVHVAKQQQPTSSSARETPTLLTLKHTTRTLVGQFLPEGSTYVSFQVIGHAHKLHSLSYVGFDS